MKLNFAIFYANGVPTFSPGLRGTRYPGSSPRKTSQPQRGCGPCDAASANPDGTALRFGSFVAHEPRVGLIAFGQPWAEGRKPVGLMDTGSCPSASFLQIVRSLTAQSPVLYANGVPPSSPGLRGTRYPGSSPRKMSQPQRGCAPCDAASANPDGTALRFGSFVAHEPRVGLIAFGQPWAEGRKPVGLGIFYANGVPPFSPGLRGTRYPGSSPRKTSQPQRGCAPCDAAPAKPDGTALRFGSFAAHEPRVGLIAFGQPWAEGRKPVGLGIFYANGVPPSSPGLRDTRYPGSSSRKMSQPQRGCGPCGAAFAKPDGTALRFGSFAAHEPRVGLIAFGQPWAEGRKPVGLMDSGSCPSASFLQIMRSLTAQSPAPYANGVPPSSPGLRGTRYPGSLPRKTSQPQRGCAHAVSSRALENERTETLTALDGFLTGLGYLK